MVFKLVQITAETANAIIQTSDMIDKLNDKPAGRTGLLINVVSAARSLNKGKGKRKVEKGKVRGKAAWRTRGQETAQGSKGMQLEGCKRNSF